MSLRDILLDPSFFPEPLTRLSGGSRTTQTLREWNVPTFHTAVVVVFVWV